VVWGARLGEWAVGRGGRIVVMFGRWERLRACRVGRV
jgi:hypothetical protein